MTWPLTPWSTAKQRPARVGSYLTRWDKESSVVLREWDGTRWSVGDYMHPISTGFEFAGLAFDPASAEEARVVFDTRSGPRPGVGWWVPKP